MFSIRKWNLIGFWVKSKKILEDWFHKWCGLRIETFVGDTINIYNDVNVTNRDFLSQHCSAMYSGECGEWRGQSLSQALDPSIKRKFSLFELVENQLIVYFRQTLRVLLRVGIFRLQGKRTTYWVLQRFENTFKGILTFFVCVCLIVNSSKNIKRVMREIGVCFDYFEEIFLLWVGSKSGKLFVLVMTLISVHIKTFSCNNKMRVLIILFFGKLWSESGEWSLCEAFQVVSKCG